VPVSRPLLLGLSDLVLGSAPPSYDRGLGYDWTEAINASIELTKEVAPVVVDAVKKGKKKHASSGKQRAEAPPPAPASAAPTVPAWAPAAAIGATAIVGVILLTRRPQAAPVPIPARNPRRRSRHVR